jgi:hypothetical protein
METQFNIYKQTEVNGQTSSSLIETATMDQLVQELNMANQLRDQMIEIAALAQKKVDLATAAAQNNQTDIMIE